ncbi:MAG: CAP domain-containing protein [Bacteroidia bacterium]|nr:CAP domain-containing protein [Bacteroidia bacterium]NNJ56161.1 hypothetical protein [Bacteroidia bacterium]
MEFEIKVDIIVEEMRRLIRIFLPVCLTTLSLVSFGQLDKIEIAIEDGNFKRVEKLCLNAFESKEMRKIPEIYYYYAQAMYELSLDEIYFDKNPDAVKEALKAVKKGKRKDEGHNILEAFEDEINKLAVRQNELAMKQYNINKMSKAAGMFDMSYQLNQNRFAYLMSAKSALTYEDSAKADSTYANLIQWYNEDLNAGDEEAEQSLDPHVYFINKHWESKKYDSAKYFIANGREIFGNDAKLNYYHKEITMEQIKNMTPSNLMMEYIKEVINYVPADKDLLHQENAIYIFLIKNKMNSDNTEAADLLIDQFVSEKVARSTSKEVAVIKETDVFVEKKPENVLWKLSEYFQTYNHLVSAKHVLNKYIVQTAKDSSESAIADRWGVITNYAYDTKSLPFAAFILQQAISKYPNNIKLTDLRRKIISDKSVVRANVDEQGAIYSLMSDEYAENKTEDNRTKMVEINDKYLGLLIAANRFSSANDVMEEQMMLDPDADHKQRLEFIAREDFYQNYFLTKTKGKDQEGKEIEAFKWNGSTSGCDAGDIELDIQNKVANRINYFRRNAGVPEVLFDQATNEYCQKAALMMTANRKLDHEPTKSWRCFSDEGAYAAKHSLLIKDANTSLAVTYIMDDKNPSAGNRRWLLYPNGRVYGHGSTDDVAVIWALDDSGSTDTSQYMDNPVCWPPKGDVPQLMLLTNWTFSLYRDLTDATVEIKQDGKQIDVAVEKYVEGYGAPTLVFKPSIVKTSLPEKSVFDVIVTLSDGRKYSYAVRTFSYNPGR